MLSKEEVLELIRNAGLSKAQKLQSTAGALTGTQLYETQNDIPNFTEAVTRVNMLDRDIGFVCKSPSGRIVRLLQRYDSSVYTQEPEELPAQWGFKWSQNPAHALPFIALATSPYNKGDCCIYEGKTWRSGQDGNVWSPGTTGVAWEEVTE